jgi:PTH1 family peptidyl-tRNA hydrolase
MTAVVGLGNPGRDYARSRHNAGRLALEAFAEGRHLRALPPHPLYKTAALRMGGREVWLVAPKTFMNESGAAVAALPGPPTGDELMLAYDDVDLPFGSLRLRRGGGDGGHRGVRDVIAALGSDDFLRLRLGIGRNAEEDTRDYVLSKFRENEEAALPEFLQRAAGAIECFLAEGFTAAMNKFNRRVPGDSPENQ